MQLFLVASSYKFLKMKPPPYADLWSFFKKKSSSHSSKLCGFVPLFLLCASCLSQSCVEAWLRFSSFFPSLRSEILLLHCDWTLPVDEKTRCQILSFSVFDWGLGQTLVYFHAAVLLQSKMAFRKKMRKSWGHLWAHQLWNGRWLLQGQNPCRYLGMCWGKYSPAAAFLSRRNIKLLLALFVLMKLSWLSVSEIWAYISVCRWKTLRIFWNKNVMLGGKKYWLDLHSSPEYND